ncbi:MAG: TRAP transporter large permease subunit, partial [Acetobacteraceae bacterium]
CGPLVPVLSAGGAVSPTAISWLDCQDHFQEPTCRVCWLPRAGAVGDGSSAAGVGIFVPPIGIGFFVSCLVMHAKVEDTSKAILPYMPALPAGILMLAYVPWFSVVLLNVVGR